MKIYTVLLLIVCMYPQSSPTRAKDTHDAHKLLLLASKDGDLEAAQQLLSSGVDVNCTDELGNTPLHLATASLHSDLVHVLLDRGANPNLKNHARESAASLAVHSSSKEDEILTSLKIIVWAGGFPDRKAINRAALSKKWKIVNYLVESGGNPNAAFPYALLYGQREVSDFLVLHGATANAFTDSSQTHLHILATFGDSDHVVGLLKMGADPRRLDAYYGESALHVVNDIDSASALLRAGGRLDEMNYKGYTPVRKAFLDGRLELYNWMLDQCHGQEPTPRLPSEGTDSNAKAKIELIPATTLLIEQAIGTGDKSTSAKSFRLLVRRGPIAISELIGIMEDSTPAEPFANDHELFTLLARLTIAVGPKAVDAVPTLTKGLQHRHQVADAAWAIMAIKREFATDPSEKHLREKIAKALYHTCLEVAESNVQHDKALKEIVNNSEVCGPLLHYCGEEGKHYLRKLGNQ